MSGNRYALVLAKRWQYTNHSLITACDWKVWTTSHWAMADKWQLRNLHKLVHWRLEAGVCLLSPYVSNTASLS